MAANGVYGGERTFPIGVDLSAFQYMIMKLNGSGAIIPATASTDKLIGVLQDNMPLPAAATPTEIEYANVALTSYPGTLKVIAGGTIAIGDQLTTNSSSQAIATTTSGDRTIGQALHAAVAGDLVEFMPDGGKI